MPRHWLIRSLLAGAMLACIGGCAYFGKVLDDPELEITALEHLRSTPDHVRVVAKLTVHNPTRITLVITRLTYRLRVQGHEIAAGTLQDLPVVPKLSTGVLEIPVQIARADWPTAARGADLPFSFSGKLFPTDAWSVDSFAFSGRGKVPTYTLPIGTLTGGRVADTGLRLRIALRNPNPMPLTLVHVEGRFSLAERSWPLSEVPAVTVPAQGVSELDLPVNAPGAADAWTAGRTPAYILESEFDLAAPQGHLLTVLRATGQAGPDWLGRP